MIVNGYSSSVRSAYNRRIGSSGVMKRGMSLYLQKESIGSKEVSHLSASPLRFQSHHLPIRLWSKSDDDCNDIPSFSSSSNIDNMKWGMEQDWELEELVPNYTIESSIGSTYATFWTQLRHSSSPALASCSEEELESKYRSLFDDALTKRKNKPLQPCGPSPTTLSDWDIYPYLEKSLYMSGKSPDGSEIRFEIQSLVQQTGTEQQPSYVESIDGVIYELIHAPSDHRQQEVKSMKNDLSLMENARSLTISIYNGTKESIAEKGFVMWYLEPFFYLTVLFMPPLFIFLCYGVFLPLFNL